MYSLEELKTVIAGVISRFGVENVRQIENDMTLEDKISLFYLLKDEPEECLNDLTKNNCKNIVTDWCLYFLDLGEWKLRLVESLALMQNFRTLQKLGYKKIHLNETRNVLDRAIRNKKFDFRKALYSAVDNLTIKELELLILEIDGESIIREPSYLYKPHHIELYLLEWQISGKIKLDIDSLNKLVTLFESLKFTYASESLKCFLDKLTSSDNKETLEEDEINIEISDSDVYPIIDHNNIGLCVIVNQNNYDHSSGHDLRRGSNFDCQRLMRTMSLMKIKCILLFDLNGNDIFPSIEKAIKDNFKPSVHSVLFVVVMAHGEKSHIFGIDGKSVDTNCIRSSLSNATLPCLEGKPKIIIFQACRGSSHYHSKALEADGSERPIIKTSMDHYIICYSTIPGFKTYRDIDQGSPYIITLCDCLESLYKHKHILDIITQVQKKFNNDKELLYKGFKVSMIAECSSSLEGHVYLY